MTDIDYLALGGVELGNNSRAYANAMCSGCCVGAIKCDGCEGTHDATNAFTNAVKEWQQTAVNLYTNPSFETSGAGTAEIRRNLIVDPRGTDATKWTGTAPSGTSVSDTPMTGNDDPLALGTFIRETAAGATTYIDIRPIGSSAADRVPVTAGAAYSMSMYMRASFAPDRFAAYIQWYDAAGTIVTTDALAPQPLAPVPANTWYLGKYENITAPTGAVGASPIFRFLGAAPAGATLDGTGAVFEAGRTVGPYFDGGQRPIVRENGVVNPSFENTLNSWGWSGGASGALSKTWADSGEWSLRVVATPSVSTGDVRMAGGSTTSFPAGMRAGGTYTFSATLNKTTNWTMDPSDGSRQPRLLLWISTNGTGYTEMFGTRATDAAGVERLSYTFTIPENATGALLALGCAGGPLNDGKIIYWDSVMLEEGTGGKPYFDASLTPPDGFTYSWFSTPHASRSRMFDADLTAAWAGAANGSASTLTGFNLAAAGDSTYRETVFSSRWAASGDHSMRIINTPAGMGGGNGGAIIGGFTLTPGQTYTVLATSYTEVSEASSNVQIYTLSPSTNSPIGAVVAGVPTQRRLTFTAAAGTSVRLAGDNDYDVWWDDVLIVEGAYDGGYFDGSTLPDDVADPDRTRVSWTGAQDASTSVLETLVTTAPAQSTMPPYGCDRPEFNPWYDPDTAASSDLVGFYLLSVQGLTDSTMTATTVESIGDGGVIGYQRHTSRAVRVRQMIVACSTAGAEYGLAWLKAAVGRSFCGRHGDACGTTDLQFFIDCPPAIDPQDDDYAAVIAPYKRWLHGVACTSGPIISEQVGLSSGGVIYVVEYILTAETPFVYGETIPLDTTGTLTTAFDDIPYNLMLHPSVEVSDNIPQIIATNYATNGSAEYGTTGWSAVKLPASGAPWGSRTVTLDQATDIKAVGAYAARGIIGGSGNVDPGTGQVQTRYVAPLSGMPAGSRPSLSAWVRMNATLGSDQVVPSAARVFIEWLNAGGSVVSSTPVQTLDGAALPNGVNVSAKGLTIPATATQARIVAEGTFTFAAAGVSNAVVYVDALALTVP